MEKDAKIYVAGHRGMVGSAVVRTLRAEGYEHLILHTRDETDLLDGAAVRGLFEREKPEYVVMAAAKVGGIKASMTHQAEFLYENLQIQNNVIWEARRSGVKKLLFLGSSCIYPLAAPQPMKEEYLLEGKLEPTAEGYALAKIAGIKLCEYLYSPDSPFISCMPTNLYGENDNFDLESSHVIPALMRRFHEAKTAGAAEVVVWGSGTSRREFLHVDDLADAVLFLMNRYDEKVFVNIGTGVDISIRELAETLKNIVGYTGTLVFDTTKPDGMPRKLLDVGRMSALGWRAVTPLEEGLQKTYQSFLKKYA